MKLRAEDREVDSMAVKLKSMTVKVRTERAQCLVRVSGSAALFIYFEDRKHLGKLEQRIRTKDVKQRASVIKFQK